MYKAVQKKSSFWTPASSQSKSKSLSKPGTFSVQPKSESKSSEQQEIPSYSSSAADALAANVMRSLETPQQSVEEGKDVGAMSLGVGVQTKLTVGAPGDKYEQEADQVAAQVMSMSVTPDHSPQVQRFGEEDNPVQRWSLAQSITPVVHRRVDEQVQMRQLVQRAFQTGGNQASGDLESRLNASKGGGSALAPEVRAFMEPRFGADFSGVRVHTGSEAVQMNRELGAQAFAHGSDVYFGEGKSPGNNELTAHELTHVVQQSGSLQMNPGATGNTKAQSGSTNIQPPTLKLNTYQGKTIQDVAANLPEEAGSVEFDFTVQTQGDPITKATLNVSQIMTMPKWAEYSKQCPAAQKSWDNFYSALKKHEDGHVAINNQQFPSTHKRFIGKPNSEVNNESDALRAKVQAVNDKYDATTDHGRKQNPPTEIDLDVSCAKKGKQSLGDAEESEFYTDNTGANEELVQTKPLIQKSSKDESGVKLSQLLLSPDVNAISRQPKADNEADRVATLKANYEAAVKKSDWDQAALLLNGFNDADILSRLKRLGDAQREELYKGALRSMPGWHGRVTQPITKLNAELARVAELKANYEAAVKKPDWEQAALLLNGFNDTDILSRVKGLNTTQREDLYQGALKSMPGWHGRVTQPIEALRTIAQGVLVDQYEEALYDIDYRHEGGNCSKWLRLKYADGVEVDLYIDRIGDGFIPPDEALQALQQAQAGDGGRMFPKQLNRSTTPRLWAAKQEAIQIMNEYFLDFLKASIPAVLFVITMATSATPASGLGVRATRRTIPRGSGLKSPKPLIFKVKPGSVVNVGGELEALPGEVIVNPGRGTMPIDKLRAIKPDNIIIEAGAEAIPLEDGIASLVKGRKLPNSIDWSKAASEFRRILQSKGKVEISVYGSGKQLASELQKQGFADVKVMGDVVVTAIKP
jgi:hypothetical protein